MTRTDRSVTAQSDRSPHRLDRSPHSPIGHRTVRSVTAQARSVTAQSDRSPHRLDRSPHSPIGHRTGSIGHRTVRSVTAQARSVTAQARSVTAQARSVTAQGNRKYRKFYFGEFLIDGNMSKAFFKNSKPDFEKRVYVLLGHRNDMPTVRCFSYFLFRDTKVEGRFYGGPEVHKRVFRNPVSSF